MRLKYSRLLITVSVVLTLFGGLFLAIGGVAYASEKHKEKKCTYKVTATVQSNERGSGGAYYPMYGYSYNGRSYRIRSSSGSNPPQFRVGEKVDMYIDPSSPSRYYVPADKTRKIVTMVFTIIGSVIAALGIIVPMIIARIRYNQNASQGYTEGDYIGTVDEYNVYDNDMNDYI